MDRPSPTGGRRQGEGKGEGSAPRTAAPTALQTGLQFLTKDFLRFWMVDICQERPARHWAHAPDGAGSDWGWGCGGEKAHAHDWRGWKLRLGPWRGEGAPHPRRVRPSSSWLPALLWQGRHKTQAQLNPCFCGTPEGWNRAQRRARSI